MIRAALYGLGAGLASTVLNDTMVKLAVIAAGVAGGIYLFQRAADVIELVVEIMRRALTGWKSLDGLPKCIEDLRGEIGQALDGIRAEILGEIGQVKERVAVVEHKTAVAQEAGEAIVRDLGIEHRQPPAPPDAQEPPAAA